MMTSFAHRYRTCCKTAVLAVAPTTISSNGMSGCSMARTRIFRQGARPPDVIVFFLEDEHEHEGHIPTIQHDQRASAVLSVINQASCCNKHNPMAHGSKKHLTKKERKALAEEARFDRALSAVTARMRDSKHMCVVDGEPCSSMSGVRIMYNELIDKGQISLDDALLALQVLYATTDTHRTVTPCSFCGKKLGVEICSGCPKTSHIRYCSRECQTGAWPKHKAVCSSRLVLDVE